jgi:hypothetical protein
LSWFKSMSGSQAAALTSAPPHDAQAELERFQPSRQDSGRKLSLLAAVAEFCGEAKMLNGHTLHQAVDGSLSLVLTVKLISLREAIEQFIAFRKSKTVAVKGRGPQRSFDHWDTAGATCSQPSGGQSKDRAACGQRWFGSVAVHGGANREACTR